MFFTSIGYLCDAIVMHGLLLLSNMCIRMVYNFGLKFCTVGTECTFGRGVFHDEDLVEDKNDLGSEELFRIDVCDIENGCFMDYDIL